MISQVEGGPRNTVDEMLHVEAIEPLQQKLEAKVFVLQRAKQENGITENSTTYVFQHI